MIEKRIAVIGTPGKWSTEVLADHLQRLTGFRCVVDMAEVVLELASGLRGMDGDTLREKIMRTLYAGMRVNPPPLEH